MLHVEVRSLLPIQWTQDGGDDCDGMLTSMVATEAAQATAKARAA